MISSPIQPLVRLVSFFVLTAVLAFAPAQAATLYDNVTNFTGFGLSNGGAGATGAFFTTRIVADNLTLAAGSAGQTISGFSFTATNFNTVGVSARPHVIFYAVDGSGNPGVRLTDFTFGAFSFSASSGAILTFNPGTPLFTVPATGSLWAGVYFDNSGTTATEAQLNSLGQALYNPPTIGSSSATYFTSTGVGSNANNPAGSIISPASGLGNFGWRLFSPNVPDAGSTLIMLMLGVSGLLCAQRRLSRSRQ